MTVDGMTLQTGHQKKSREGNLWYSCNHMPSATPSFLDMNFRQLHLPGPDKPLFSLYLIIYH